jgi:hypothetical protein
LHCKAKKACHSIFAPLVDFDKSSPRWTTFLTGTGAGGCGGCLFNLAQIRPIRAKSRITAPGKFGGDLPAQAATRR